jgi:hypothetical protein
MFTRTPHHTQNSTQGYHTLQYHSLLEVNVIGPNAAAEKASELGYFEQIEAQEILGLQAAGIQG